MVTALKVDEFVREYRDKIKQEDQEEIYENKMECLKKYLVEAQSLIQKTLHVVEDNTQSASLSLLSCDEVVSYAIRTQSQYTCPTYEEVFESYLVKLTSRGNQKAKDPCLSVFNQPIQITNEIQHIQIGVTHQQPNILIQPFRKDDRLIFVTEDKQMPNINIHQIFSQTYKKSEDGSRDLIELRFLAYGTGALESDLQSVVIDMKHYNPNAQQQAGIQTESLKFEDMSSNPLWSYQS